MAPNDGSFGSNFANFLTGMTGEIYKRQAEEQAIKQKDEDSALQLNLNLFSNMLQHPGQFNEQQIRQHADMVAKNPRMGRIVGKDYQNQITPLLQATGEAYRNAKANGLEQYIGPLEGKSMDELSQGMAHMMEYKRAAEIASADKIEKNRQWQADYDLAKRGQDATQTYRQTETEGNIQGRKDASAMAMELLKRQIEAEGKASDFRIQSLLGDQQSRNSQYAFQSKSLELQKDQYSPENRQKAEENDAFRTALSAAMSSGQMTSDQAIEAGKQAALAVRSRYALTAPPVAAPKPATGFQELANPVIPNEYKRTSIDNSSLSRLLGTSANRFFEANKAIGQSMVNTPLGVGQVAEGYSRRLWDWLSPGMTPAK